MLSISCLLRLLATVATVTSALETCQSKNGRLRCVLRVEVGRVELNFKNISFNARTYNGMVPGPVLRAAPGDQVEILLQNRLGSNAPGIGCKGPLATFRAANSTNLHIHGIYAGIRNDNTEVCLDPNDAFLYQLSLDPRMGTSTMWYHPHLDGSSAMQLYGGMAGAFEVVDPIQEVAFDFVFASTKTFVLQLLDFSQLAYFNTGGTSTLPLNLHNPENFTGMLMVVNGAVEPSMVLQSGRQSRLKLINAMSGVKNNLILGFGKSEAKACQLHVLAYDGVWLKAPRLQKSVAIPAGGRADVSVACNSVGFFQLSTLSVTIGEYGVPGSLTPEGLVALMLDVRGSAHEEQIAALPSVLPGPPVYYADLSEAEFCPPHTIMLSNELGDNIVNGWPYNGTVSYSMELGSVQEWHLIGGEGHGLSNYHPYHQHTVHFQIMSASLNTGGLFGEVGDWRDTLPLYRALNFTVRFVPAFPGVMMIHCHILSHEDRGMMTLANVTAAPVSHRVESGGLPPWFSNQTRATHSRLRGATR